jgi:hypothetical protein
MDNQENPRQHRKTRLHVLHPKHINGRTDSDTFFATVKSVQGFRCVQMFFCNIAKFLFVKGMRKESHSHGAYQAFVRDEGVPNLLLTDTSRTQTRKKWMKTSRENITKQINSVPHNQHSKSIGAQDSRHQENNDSRTSICKRTTCFLVLLHVVYC